MWFSLGLLTILTVTTSRAFGVNPDNVATPIAAALGDMTTLFLLSCIASLLYTSAGIYSVLSYGQVGRSKASMTGELTAIRSIKLYNQSSWVWHFLFVFRCWSQQVAWSCLHTTVGPLSSPLALRGCGKSTHETRSFHRLDTGHSRYAYQHVSRE